jgi:hypothetical protein
MPRNGRQGRLALPFCNCTASLRRDSVRAGSVQAPAKTLELANFRTLELLSRFSRISRLYYKFPWRSWRLGGSIPAGWFGAGGSPTLELPNFRTLELLRVFA